MSQFEHDSDAGCFDSQHLWGRLPMKTILAAAAALSWPPRLPAAHQLQVRAVTISGDCISKGQPARRAFRFWQLIVGWNTRIT